MFRDGKIVKEGKSWPWKLQYYQGPSGYSDGSVLPDGRVAILFEKDGKHQKKDAR